jgi:hypothetical protein
VPRRSDDLMHPDRPLIGIRLYREGQVMPQSAITTPNLEKGREDLGRDRAVLAIPQAPMDHPRNCTILGAGWGCAWNRQ